ncbi:MAG: hypothetical protein GEU79_16465 [Acidimicrobiia bacterium]|nr:hypothetical protein [Acidimicrobiia bacterium]
MTELDVYLDPDWALGEGFDYSSAVNNTEGTHLRDYVFHITKDTSENAPLFGVSNNSNLNPKETIETGVHYNFTEQGKPAGWYTLRHTFWNDAGNLRVDLSLHDTDGTQLFSESLPPDTHPIQNPIEDVGGNRYGWFSALSEEFTLHIDHTQLCLGSEGCSDEPPPTTTTTTGAPTTTTEPTTTSTTSTSTTSTTSAPTTTTVPEPAPEFGDVPEDNIFAEDIEWLAAEGITFGCNPPANTMFCPEDSVSRGQMAAFINRAIDLPEATQDHFVDDDDSVFEDDINRLAESGITQGCNPPDNSQYCPSDNVLRQEMASFLTRAYGFVDGDPATDRFVDDDGSIHEGDIEALASSGVTVGCNPPDNDMFCPEEEVLRQQMAAFLHRAATD